MKTAQHLTYAKRVIMGLVAVCVLICTVCVSARGGSEYEPVSGVVGIATEINGAEYSVEGFIEYSESDQYDEYVLLSGGVGIASESSGGEYTQTGSVVLTDGNDMSGGEYTVVEETAAVEDCVVCMEHFSRFAVHWLEKDCSELNEWCGGADLFEDEYNTVDWFDLEVFTYEWLYYCPVDWPLK